MVESVTKTPLVNIVEAYFRRTLAGAGTEFYKDFFPDHLNAIAAFADLLIATEPEARNANREVVTLSILLHDIGYMVGDTKEISDHATRSEIEARRLLEDLHAPSETVDAVCHCVGTHRNRPDNEPQTIEAKILVAADSAAHMSQDSYSTRNIPHATYGHSVQKLRRDYRDLGFFPSLQNRFKYIYEDWERSLPSMF